MEIFNTIVGILKDSGLVALFTADGWKNGVMILVACGLLFLAIHPKFQFEPLLLLRELDNKAARLDGGKALLRPSLPYDDVLRQETFFLDLYISGRYAPEPMVPGCVCLATSLSGTVLLHAEGQNFQLLERDALRFAADQPFWLENQFNGTARLLLTYRYLK